MLTRRYLLVLVLLPALAPFAVLAQAPPYPSFITITVTERGGTARTGWPVTVGVPIRCGEVKDPSTFLYLVRSDLGKNEPVPFQLFDIVTPTAGPEIQAAIKAPDFPKDRLIMRLFEIGFPVDLQPNAANTYLLYYGTPTGPVTPVAPPVPLGYTGDNPGISIDAGDVIFHLNPKSGSVLYFTPKFSAEKKDYHFKQAARRDVHYNPDVFVPQLSWGHISDWDMTQPGLYAPTVKIARGPFAYRSFRTGVIPRSNETKATVTYTFYAGLPFFYTSSSMEFTLDTNVFSVRNSEYVFSRGMMTHGFWADENGNPKDTPLLDPANPARVFGKVAVLPSNIPYLGMFNEVDGVGICLVNLAYYVGPHNMADDAANLWSQFYISDPGLHMPNNPVFAFTYLVRPEIYHQTVVPKGAIFAERNAIVIFRVGQGDKRYEDLLRWIKLIRTPPAVNVSPVIMPPL